MNLVTGAFVPDVLRVLKPINHDTPYSYSGQSGHVVNTIV